MSNDQERSSLARQYEAAVRRNRSVPASYSLAPRRPAPRPPVAGPEVRPDETLRAAIEALCDEADHVATGSTGRPVGAIVRVRDLRDALADAAEAGPWTPR